MSHSLRLLYRWTCKPFNFYLRPYTHKYLQSQITFNVLNDFCMKSHSPLPSPFFMKTILTSTSLWVLASTRWDTRMSERSFDWFVRRVSSRSTKMTMNIASFKSSYLLYCVSLSLEFIGEWLGPQNQGGKSSYQYLFTFLCYGHSSRRWR